MGIAETTHLTRPLAELEAAAARTAERLRALRRAWLRRVGLDLEFDIDPGAIETDDLGEMG